MYTIQHFNKNRVCSVIPKLLIDSNDKCPNNYTPTYINANSFLLNGEYNISGIYCWSHDTIRCNSFTSILSFHNGMWICIPKTKYFGGKQGTEIIGCKSKKIINNTNGMIYDKKISIDENVDFNVVLDNGKKQYSCYNNNKYDDEEIENYCTKYIASNNISGILLNKRDNLCYCNNELYDNYKYGNKKTACVSCKERISDRQKFKNWKDYAIQINRLCLKEDSVVKDIIFQNLLPCGIDTLNDSSKDYCETGYILASNNESPFLKEYISVTV